MKPRNKALARAQQEARVLPIDGRIAGCVLQALTSKETARALGVSVEWVEKREQALRRRYGARNRVALALKLAEVAQTDQRASQHP